MKMLNGGKAVRDRDGKIIEAAAFQKGEKDAKPGRVQPDRRWFGELDRCYSSQHGSDEQATPESSLRPLWTTSGRP